MQLFVTGGRMYPSIKRRPRGEAQTATAASDLERALIQSRAEVHAQNEQLLESQRQLESSRHEYAELYDFAPVGYVSMDRHGFVRDANRTASELLGVPREVWIGAAFIERVLPLDQGMFLRHLNACRAGQHSETECRLLVGEHRSLYAHLISRPSRSRLGETLFRTAIVDVTDRVLVRQQLEASHRELLEKTEQLVRGTKLLRQLWADLSRAEERERRRLAAVLHDHLQQLLFAARIKLLTVDAQHERGMDSLEQADALLLDAIQSCRTLATELSPSVLYDQGLLPALGWLAADMLAKHGANVVVYGPRDLTLDQHVAVTLYHATREAMFNVVKHAGAQRTIVRVRQFRGFVWLSIKDDGVGFEVERSSQRLGGSREIGLPGVAERVASVGGALRLRSAPGFGTHVLIVVPRGIDCLDAPAPAQTNDRRRRSGEYAVHEAVHESGVILRAALVHDAAS
jgi:PAS domain S-box-containing protein